VHIFVWLEDQGLLEVEAGLIVALLFLPDEAKIIVALVAAVVGCVYGGVAQDADWQQNVSSGEG
jgi:hypothetical protein